MSISPTEPFTDTSRLPDVYGGGNHGCRGAHENFVGACVPALGGGPGWSTRAAPSAPGDLSGGSGGRGAIDHRPGGRPRSARGGSNPGGRATNSDSTGSVLIRWFT